MLDRRIVGFERQGCPLQAHHRIRTERRQDPAGRLHLKRDGTQARHQRGIARVAFGGERVEIGALVEMAVEQHGDGQPLRTFCRSFRRSHGFEVGPTRIVQASGDICPRRRCQSRDIDVLRTGPAGHERCDNSDDCNGHCRQQALAHRSSSRHTATSQSIRCASSISGNDTRLAAALC
jgi:hypothetical protein